MQRNNRLLSKFAFGRQGFRTYGTENRSVLDVGEDLSSGVTTQLASEVEFSKKSNENFGNEIIILGLGLSGMLAAIALYQQNYRITIIEKLSSNSENFFRDPRTTAITDSSRSYLEEIGIWKDLQDEMSLINDIYVVDNKSPNMLHFNSKFADEKSPMGYIIENRILKKILLNIVKNLDINLLEETNYKSIVNSAENISIELSDGTIKTASLVIVCDGKNSSARNNYFSFNRKKSYHQIALTFLVKHEKPHEGTAVEHFMHTGPFAILPLKDPYISSIVWTLDEKKTNALLLIDRAEFTHIVQENFGEFLGKISLVNDPACFNLSAEHADRYVRGRMVLISDTAHIIHPLAGQGLNQGIKDISEIVHKLKTYAITKTPLEDLLKDFEKSRYKDNSNMLEITDSLNAVFTNNSHFLKNARSIGFKTIENMSPFKKMLIKYAMGKRK